jgi:competence protein ComEA
VSDLTDAERRGALWIAALIALGVLHDLVAAVRPARAPAVPEPVPASAPSAPGAAAGDSLAGRGGLPRLDLNRAGAAELDRLPGIGPVLARRIVEHRERNGRFRSADELLAVPGIGPRLLERLRPHLATDPR